CLDATGCEEAIQMFDTNATFTLGGLRVAGIGKVDITVRWPTDEEWGAHRKRSKVIMRQTGRASQIEADTLAADAKLYDTIKVNGAPQLSPDEASTVISHIARCEPTGASLGSDEAEVTMDVAGAKPEGENLVTHRMRIPTMEEVHKLQRTTKF